MTSPELRICLVGFGSIARTHASALAALPSVRALPFRPVLAAIVSDRPADVAADAALLGARVLTLDEALADASLDVFDVTTRNVRHLDQAGAILRAGQPLYLEKPIGRMPEEADALAALAAASAAPSQVGLVIRYAAAVVEARALLRAGVIGELRQARLGLFHGSYLDPARPISWRLQADQAGGGAMLDLGLHLVDLLRFLFGEPELLAARHATFLVDRPDGTGGRRPVDVDDWAWAEVRLPGGGRATVEASRISLGSEGGPLELYGSEGSLVADLEDGRPPRLHRFDGREAEFRGRAAADPELRAARGLRPPARLTLGPFVDGHAAALHHFLLRVLGGDPIPGFAPTLADSAAAERLVAATTAAPD
ncbi:MAG TPA: Gfo/Idh/MocA family oxidoreductase [Propionibacteriaceae bacterium]